MRVEVKVIRESESDVERQSASVETHTKRGDAFNIHSAKDVMEGESQTFIIPPSGRIVINTPLATEKPVYDREQGAAVYASQQRQGGEGADRADVDAIVKAKEAELAQAKDQAQRQKEEDQRKADAAAAAARTPPQGGQPLVGGKPAQPGMTAQGAPANATAKTTTTPSTTPAHGGAPAPQGGNTTEKK